MLANSAMEKETFYERSLLTKLSDNGTYLIFTNDEAKRLVYHGADLWAMNWVHACTP